VQEAERFEPDRDEIAKARAKAEAPTAPLLLRIDAERLTPGLLDELKAVFEHHKGEADVHVAITPGDGEPTRLVLGDDYRVRPSSGLRAELGHVLGPDALAA
jgi:DNA polymerase-3 subunit alpha